MKSILKIVFVALKGTVAWENFKTNTVGGFDRVPWWATVTFNIFLCPFIMLWFLFLKSPYIEVKHISFSSRTSMHIAYGSFRVRNILFVCMYEVCDACCVLGLCLKWKQVVYPCKIISWSHYPFYPMLIQTQKLP